MIDWSKLNPKTVVRCMSEEEVRALAMEAKEQFPYKDISERTFVRWFGVYEDTCFNLRVLQRYDGVTYSEEGFYLAHGYSVVRYSDLVANRDYGEFEDSKTPIEFLFDTEEATEC